MKITKAHLLKTSGVLLLSSPFLAIAIIIPTITHSWDVALPGYAMALGVCLVVGLGMYLLTLGENAEK